MKKLFWTLTLALSCIANPVLAKDYLLWQFPSGEIQLPVYVYQDGKQTDFIPSNNLQYFAGEFDPKATNATYTLYYQSGINWHGCKLVLKDGLVDNSKGITTCTGAVINSPDNLNGAQSNVYTTGLGDYEWPAAVKPENPTKTNYSNRKIKLVNNTAHPYIQVGESCSTSVGENSAPSCQTNPIIALISNNPQNNTHTITVDENGLDSSAFYMSAYCAAYVENDCGTPPTANDCQTNGYKNNWVCTGGYFAGQTPYASKIEPTILKVTNGVPDGASNIDISAVDGYNTSVKLYPESLEYCTYTVPPENSNVLGAGSYDSATPLAEINPSEGLESLCKSSSQLPTQNLSLSNTQAWNLLKTDEAGNFKGCVSPCSYASTNQKSSKDSFCCQGAFSTPDTCDVTYNKQGANTSTYNKNVVKSFKNVYGYAFGDAGSDFACPPETNFIIEFVSPK